MRQRLVVGNWKMNGSRSSIETLLAGIKAGAASVTVTQMAVCPPFVYLAQVAEALQNTQITWGSQNLAKETGAGAFTGEVSAEMLKDFACTYALVGHSERRSLYAENDPVVAAKFAAALQAGLTPILCLGESLQEREAGQTETVIARQLDVVIAETGVDAFAKAVIAYEPVWAIGTGKTASPAQAQAVHAFIRQRVAASAAAIADGLQILYGGSVKPDNATELFAMPDIDGGLIGGAALQAEDFLGICQVGS